MIWYKSAGIFYIYWGGRIHENVIINLSFFLKRGRLIFADLRENGLEILKILIDLGVEIKRVTIFNLTIYSIQTGYGCIKCYENFGFQLNCGEVEKLFKNLGYLEDFLIENFNSSLNDFKINGVGSIAALYLKKKSNLSPFIKLDETLEKFIRSAYYGGRCELFLPGSYDQLYFYDFSSMYGNIMLGDFPTKIFKKIEITYSSLNEPGFYEVTVTQNNNHPVLPHKINSSLFFLNGEFRGVYWWEELVLFKELGGAIKEFHFFAKVDCFHKIFENSVSSLLELKKNKNPFAKQVINAIYGKLAISQLNTKTNIYVGVDEATLLKKNTQRYLKHHNIFLVEEVRLNTRDLERNVMAAAIITSRARIKLYSLMKSSTDAGGDVVYVDTDSCFVSLNCIANVKEFLKLAPWKKITKSVFYCEKNYAYTDEENYVKVGNSREKFFSFKRNTLSGSRPFNAFDLLNV